MRYSAGMRFPVLCALSVALALASPARAGAACAADAGLAQLRAEQLLARGAWAQAAREYACAAAASDDPAVAERATRAAFEREQWSGALAGARRWVALEPEREEARRFLAISLLRLHRPEQATAEFRRILDGGYAQRGEGYTALLGILGAEANDAGAARVMDSLAGADPAVPEASYAASVLWQRAEHGERALAAARRALALRPDWPLATLAEARALLLLGRTDEGLGRARQAAAGGDEFVALSYAWLLAAADRRDEAAAEFEALRRGRPDVAPVLEGLGALAFDRGDFDTARRHFLELAQASRGAETGLAFLGFIADRQGEPALAVRFLERVDSGPRAVAAQLRAHELLLGLGATARAGLLLDDFLAASPEQTRDVVMRLASRLAADGQGAPALALLARLGETYPDDDDIRLAQAYVHERLDQVDAAVRIMRDVLSRRPQDPTALNALGYTLVDRTRRVREGHALIERAIAARPDSYAIIDSMGWSLFRLGRLEEARAWLDRAWGRSRDPEVAAHLGEVLWALGDRDAARALWREASEAAPDNRTLRRTLERHPAG